MPKAQGPLGPYQALSPEEVGDHFFVQVVDKASGALIIAAAVDEELLSGVLIDEGADLRGGDEARWNMVFFLIEVKFTEHRVNRFKVNNSMASK